ncbi:MAG: high-potential iron-sulfur protein [Anaerolineae bacterium]|nr:high-potential iron-sulfur protein [Ardenticatenia bacterium]MBK8542040.1 high-potential iron-sulfur protein [Ardenticatenia bacterium]HQZ70274.1 high-potential iron-sulfur protein [Anaerolineae bacterium]HRA19493.1 high-potential iron-sulfur protein [Anaerolineae bacterium]
MSDTLTRRNFIQRLAVVGTVVVGAGALAACGTEGAGTDTDDATALACTDVSALTEDEKTTRTTLNYVDASVTEGKNCTNCQQFQPDAANATASCGKCLVVPGSINPGGYCDSWAEKTA